ncbi:MAG: histidine phosphatase family protein [bacterium]|nr:histidine phosphatase family protein [bacterium]
MATSTPESAPQPPTTIYLIRHCEPEERYLDCYYGQMDIALSERGLTQSHAVAERLAGVPLDAVYSSDLQRAGYLADLLAEARGLPVRRLAVFRERHMGVLQGIPRPALESDHADLYGRWRVDRVNFRVPGAENFADVRDRIVPAARELATAFAGRRVALVCHAGPIRVLLADALGMPLDNIFRFGMNHGSIHVIEYHPDDSTRVTLMNG